MAISPLSSPSRGVPEMLAQRRKPQRTSLQGTGGITGGGSWHPAGDMGDEAHSLLVALQPAQTLAPAVAPLGPLHVELLIAEALGRAWEKMGVTCLSPADPPPPPLPWQSHPGAGTYCGPTARCTAGLWFCSARRSIVPGEQGEGSQGWGGACTRACMDTEVVRGQ